MLLHERARDSQDFDSNRQCALQVAAAFALGAAGAVMGNTFSMSHGTVALAEVSQVSTLQCPYKLSVVGEEAAPLCVVGPSLALRQYASIHALYTDSDELTCLIATCYQVSVGLGCFSKSMQGKHRGHWSAYALMWV